MTIPKPTPWEDYLAAARTLQAVRRERADASAAATHAASSARAELAQVRALLARQRARLYGEAAGSASGVRLRSSPPEQAEADSLVAGDPAAVRAALQQCRLLLAETDAALAAHPGTAGRRSRRRRLITTAIAAAVLVAAAVAATVAGVGLLPGNPF